MSPRKPSVVKMSKKYWPSWSVAAVGDDQVHVEIDVAVVQELAAGQPQVDAVDELLVAAIGTAVVVHHALRLPL